MKRLIISLLLLYNLLDIHAQFFLIDENNELINIDKNISDWTDLNLNEVSDFFGKNGIEFINKSEIKDTFIVKGKFNYVNPEVLYLVELIFVNKLIIGLSKKFYFIKPRETKILDKSGLSKFDFIKGKAEYRDQNLLQIFRDHSIFQFKTHDGNLISTFTFENKFNLEYFYYKNKKLFTRQTNYNVNNLDFEFYQTETEFKLLETHYINGIDIENFNTNNIVEMVNLFLFDCNSNGIKTSKSKIDIEFVELEEPLLGLSMGKDNDNLIKIKINKNKWDISSRAKQWYVLYHELGHDVLNFDHFEGGKMMSPISERGYSWSEFWNDRQIMFNYFLEHKLTK